MYRVTRLLPSGDQRTERVLVPNLNFLMSELKSNTIKSFIVSKA